MISDQSTSLFMLRSNVVIQQVTLLSCSSFLISSILFLPSFNAHPIETLLIPFEYPSNVDKYPSNLGSLGFAIGGCLGVVNTLFSEWAKRHERQRCNQETSRLLTMLPPDKQNMISNWHARVATRMETDLNKTPALASSTLNRSLFSLISMTVASTSSDAKTWDASPAAIVAAQTWLVKAEDAAGWGEV